jgi:hypothetical protein
MPRRHPSIQNQGPLISQLEWAVHVAEGYGISDFPLNNKSYNLSYCGFDLIEATREKNKLMLNVLKNRFEQGYRTSLSQGKNQLLPRYRGRPEIDPDAPPEVARMRRRLPPGSHRR